MPSSAKWGSQAILCHGVHWRPAALDPDAINLGKLFHQRLLACVMAVDASPQRDLPTDLSPNSINPRRAAPSGNNANAARALSASR